MVHTTGVAQVAVARSARGCNGLVFMQGLGGQGIRHGFTVAHDALGVSSKRPLMRVGDCDCNHRAACARFASVR
ncbi:MAG: hypothetical protein VX589_07265 [Myxococcota bacterium]|nr:hypothetical protein [Myxococcota bacterium]